MNLTDLLVTYVPFSHDELNDILSHFTKEHIPKNQVLVREGQICQHLYFIEEGIGRSYYLKEDGKEITQWFFGVGKFMTSADSFFNQSASYYYLETLEDTVVYSISYDKVELLLDKYRKMEKLMRLLVIETLANMVQKVNAIQFQTSKERYDYMVSDFPDISHRVPLGHIASYLGMTQETLSRIRKNDR